MQRSVALLLAVALVACGDSRPTDAGPVKGATPDAAASGSTGGSPPDAPDAATGSGAPLDGAVGSADSSTVTPKADAGGGAMTADLVRDVPGFANRPYILHAPGGLIPTTPAPVVIVFHGGGGNADGVVRMTCPLGTTGSPQCINRLADREGFLLVIPNGTGTLIAPNTRTWNAGGGTGNWQCVSGAACMRDVDDVAYFDALMADLATVATIDEHRVFLTGMSNGAAMSHRLACERADKVAAIAPVAGGNQLTTDAPCEPTRPVSVLAMHGTDDPCWVYTGGPGACLQTDNKDKIDIPRTMQEWAARNGCGDTPDVSDLPAFSADPTHVFFDDYPDCDDGAAVRLVRIERGGHTWPGGFQYASEATIGFTTPYVLAQATMWEFFAAHPIP